MLLLPGITILTCSGTDRTGKPSKILLTNEKMPEDLIVGPDITSIIDSSFKLSNGKLFLDVVTVYTFRNGQQKEQMFINFKDDSISSTMKVIYDDNGNEISYSGRDHNATLTRDEYGYKVKSEAVHEKGRISTISYQNTYKAGRLNTTTATTTSGRVLGRDTFDHDPKGQLIRQVSQNDRSRGEYIYTYDSAGRKIATEFRHNNKVSSSSTFTYNDALLVKKEVKWQESTVPDIETYHYSGKTLTEIRSSNGERTLFSNFDRSGNFGLKEVFSGKTLWYRTIRTVIKA